MTIELHISKTCMFATTGDNKGWQHYDDVQKNFPSIAAARAWLREEYGTARRAAMYRDRPTGQQPVRCGYVIGFRPKYRQPGDPVAEQHWVEFRRSGTINLDTVKE